MEVLSGLLLGILSFALGATLLTYGFRGRRESQARDARTYRRGRL